MRLRLAIGSALGWALVPALAGAEPLDVFDATPRPIRIEFEISASPGTIGQAWSAPFEATYAASGNTGTVVVSAAAYASAIATQQLDYVGALAAWTLVPGSASELRLDIDLTTLQATAQPAHYGVSLAISPPQDGVVTRNLSTTTVAGFAFLPSPAGFPFYCVPCVPVPGAPYDPATGRLNAIGSDHLVAPDVDVNGFSRAGDLRLTEAPTAVPALPGYGLLALAALLTLVGVSSSGISRRIQSRIASAM
jgi:hypothetical protein